MAGSDASGVPRRMVAEAVSTTEEFFSRFVVPRKPGLLATLPPDLEHLQGLWSDEHLIVKAGDAVLQVEQRGSGSEAFGKGDATKVSLTLRQALRRMAGGDTSLYLTTQAVPTAADGHPALYASPVAELAGDIPLVPALMGSLVPQSINIWCGAAPDGSSSGLHCDYHDNLYVLLRGRKRFRLYPPSQAKNMYTVGRVAAVHPNGRIVFRGQGDIRPDGSEAGEAVQWLARRQAEEEVAAAEEAVAQGLPGAAKRLRAAERRLDAVLEAALDGGLDDFDDLESAAAPPTPAAAGDPESFSRVDLSLPEEELRRRFPRFPGKQAAIVVDVTAGQMLYLPAGCFHEVTSFSAPGSPTHLALNFWYHPPDNLDDGAAEAMRRPYRSPYWPMVWEGRRAEYEARHRQPLQGRGPPMALPAAQGHQQQQDRSQRQAPAAMQEQRQREDRSAVKRQRRADAEEETIEGRLAEGQLFRRAVFVSTFGLFGVGRRQHLHRFVTVRWRT